MRISLQSRLAPVIESIRAERHITLRAMAGELNARGILTRRGAQWHVSNVRNLVERLDMLLASAS